MHGRWSLTLTAALGCLAVLVLATTVGAANIAGTAGNDTLRGTAKADRLTGKAGNDRLYGAAGNDVLVGGPGNDLLVGGPGNDLLVGGPGADRLSCGPGRDTARADARDRVATDCEVVTGIPDPEPSPPPQPAPPPAPAPPPVAPVTPGSYRGLLDGNFIFFEVLPDRMVTGFRSNYIQENCDQGGFVYGTVDWGTNRFPIADDGTFSASARYSGTVDDEPATFTDEVTGRFDGTTVTGTYTAAAEFVFDGTQYRCSSGIRPWTASLLP